MKIPKADFNTPCLDKLDALGWNYGFCLDFEGRLLGVRCDNPEVGELLLSMAREFGPIVDSDVSEDVVSLKVAKPSARRGTRHYNLLYLNSNVQLKSFELEEIFELYRDQLKRCQAVMTDHYVHIDDSRLFAWRADDRLISVVGPEVPCRLIVNSLRTYLEPERTSFTSIAEDGTVPFAPWNLKWRDRKIHQPLPLTDLVFLLEDGEKPLGKGEAVLRLYQLSSGKLPAEKRVSLLASALQNVRVHSVAINERQTLVQRVIDAVDLGVEAPLFTDEALFPTV